MVYDFDGVIGGQVFAAANWLAGMLVWSALKCSARQQDSLDL